MGSPEKILQNGLSVSRKTDSNGQRLSRLKVSVSVRLAPGAPALRRLVIGGANVSSHSRSCTDASPASGHRESSNVLFP